VHPTLVDFHTGPVDTLNVKPPPLPKKPRKKALKGEDLIDQAQEIDFAAMVAASGPNVEQLVVRARRPAVTSLIRLVSISRP
jgi:hypothetical protein